MAILSQTTLTHGGCLQDWGASLPNGSCAPDIESALAIASNYQIGMALLPDRTVRTWGTSQILTVPASATNVVSIASGQYHCVVAKADGNVVCWGTDGSGQSTVPPAATNVVSVAAGEKLSVALRSDGTVVAWGEWYTGSGPVSLDGVTNHVRAISAGGNHITVLKDDGTVECYGANQAGQCNTPEGLSDVIAVSGGLAHSLALRADGTVVKWGNLPEFPSTPPAGFVAIDGGHTHALGLRTNGTVVAWGTMPSSQMVPAIQGVVKAVAAGDNYSLVLKQSCIAPVLTPPTASPAIICEGATVTLTQSVSGESGPYAYQWAYNGTPIDGATSATLQIASAANNDVYTCIVTNACGATSEASITIKTGVAPNKAFARPAGTSYKIQISEIGTNLTFQSVGTGSQSATINFDSGNIYYLPAAGNNSAETFTYTVSNGQCAATGNITISVEDATGGEARHIEFTAGILTIRFSGMPGVSYSVQKAPDASFSSYKTVLTTNTPASGEFIYSETSQASGSAYYRLMH